MGAFVSDLEERFEPFSLPVAKFLLLPAVYSFALPAGPGHASAERRRGVSRRGGEVFFPALFNSDL